MTSRRAAAGEGGTSVGVGVGVGGYLDMGQTVHEQTGRNGPGEDVVVKRSVLRCARVRRGPKVAEFLETGAEKATWDVRVTCEGRPGHDHRRNPSRNPTPSHRRHQCRRQT